MEAEGCALTTATLALETEGPRPDSSTLDVLHELHRKGLDVLLLEGLGCATGAFHEDGFRSGGIINALQEMDTWIYFSSWII